MADLTLLECSNSEHGPFTTNGGAAYHATWCAEYRAAHGIPDDAPGVRTGRDKAPVTLDSIMADMAARGAAVSAPTSAPTAGETVIIGGVAYRKA